MSHHLKYIKNAYLYPATTDWEDHSLYTYGIEADNNERFPIGHFKFGRSRINTKNRTLIRETTTPKLISGTYLFLGAASSHFGHFLSECISTYWSMDKDFAINIDGVIVLPGRGERAEKNVKITLDLLGLSRNDIIFIKDYSLVEKLIVPEKGCITGQKPEKFYFDFLKKRANPEKFKNNTLPKKIFVSRRFYKNYGRVAGMDYVAFELEKKGYFELTPEKYPLKKQIEFICSADEVIWEEGSAVHLIELLPFITSKQILIMRRKESDYDYIKFILEHKSTNLITYSNVDFIECMAQPHNRMSKFNNPEEFCDFIKLNTGVILDKEKLQNESILDELDFNIFKDFNQSCEKDNIIKKIAKITKRDCYSYKKSRITRTDNVSARGPAPIIAWSIDSPRRGEGDVITYNDIDIRGWFILENYPLNTISNGELKIVSHSGREYKLSFDINRPDVINAILNKKNLSNTSSACGFSISVEFDKEFYIPMTDGNKSTILSTLTIT
ncbi:MAG TPA: hypothetical protein DEO73_02565 [Pantoea sp.]|nr:hypothetical protein [Pantoea sp.]